MNWKALVDVEDLFAKLGEPDLRIVDARFSMADPVSGRKGYGQSHLPGAVYFDLNQDLSDLRKTGQGRHPLPDSDVFAHILGQAGIAPRQQVVVYDAGDGSMAAARCWWLLKLMGHESVAVLDGGLAAWRAQGFPETSDAATPAPVPDYPGQFDTSAIVDAAGVVLRLPSAPGWLLDARAAERFRGEVEPLDPVAGHVPGAVNRPFLENMRDGRFRPAAELHDELKRVLRGRDPGEVVVMCGSGVTACHLLLGMEHAGLHGARVFAGSWSGWLSDPSRPVAVGD